MNIYDIFYGQGQQTTNPFLNQQTNTMNMPNLSPAAQPNYSISPLTVSAPVDPSLPGAQLQDQWNKEHGIGTGTQCPPGSVYDPITKQCVPLSLGGGDGEEEAQAADNSLFTTYGGHRDVAHANIDKAFGDFGAQISAGTANNADNPAFNQSVADASGEQEVNLGGGVVKKAKDLTSADFQTEAYKNLSYEEQMAANYAAAAAGGIKNVGGGYNQDDHTSNLEDLKGGLSVASRDLVDNPIGKLIANQIGIGQIAAKLAKDAPARSSWDYLAGNKPADEVITVDNAAVSTTESGEPTFVNISGNDNDDGPSAAAIAAANASSANTQVQEDYSGPSHGYDEVPSAPEKKKGGGGGKNQGGMVGYNYGGMIDPGLAMALQSTAGYNKGGMVHMQNGGITPGQPMAPSGMREGPQHDTTQAMLTPGEMVLDEDSTAAINRMAPGFLDSLNNWEPKDGPGMLMSLFDSLDDVTMSKTDKMGNKITVKSPEGTRMKTMFG